MRESSPNLIESASHPSAILTRSRHPVVPAERQHVEEAPPSHARDLARHAPSHASRRLTDDDGPGRFAKGCEPSGQPLAIERRVLMADDERSRGSGASVELSYQQI